MFNSKQTFNNPELCARLLERIREFSTPFRFMEVCGTHTVALFRSGVASLLPANITHLSGPGCPVCVTHDSEITAMLDLAGRDNVHVLTFGDLMRVPGPNRMTLKQAKAEGARVDIVYSPLEGLDIAAADTGTTVVFLGVGFETTSPAVAATVLEAQRRGLKNFTVLSCHKLVPPALHALLAPAPDTVSPLARPALEQKTALHTGIDGFILPGHVSTILGADAYQFLANTYKKPAVVTGFEAADLLQAMLQLLQMQAEGKPAVLNEYKRAVQQSGNPKAREILFKVFKISDALWRGLGGIANSGLCFTDEFAEFDAARRLDVTFKDAAPPKGCLCGAVLAGQIQPPACPLFGKACVPQNPVGPCMVSTEGSCAAYYNYAL